MGFADPNNFFIVSIEKAFVKIGLVPDASGTYVNYASHETGGLASYRGGNKNTAHNKYILGLGQPATGEGTKLPLTLPPARGGEGYVHLPFSSRPLQVRSRGPAREEGVRGIARGTINCKKTVQCTEFLNTLAKWFLHTLSRRNSD